MKVVAIAALLLASTAHAETRRAFCELLPCLGEVETRVLKRDTVISGVRCKKGEIGEHKGGGLAFCETARAQTIDGLPVAREAYTLVYPSGRLYQTHLGKAVVVDGIPCGKGLIARTETGKLRYCEPSRPWQTGTLVARAGEGLYLEDGRVLALTLDAPATISGLALPAGTRIQCDGTTLRELWVEKTIVIGALTWRGTVTLHANGRVEKGTLAVKAKLGGQELPEFTDVTFGADGVVTYAEYVEDYDTMPHGELVTKTRHLSFKKGVLASSYLDEYQSDVRPPH